MTKLADVNQDELRCANCRHPFPHSLVPRVTEDHFALIAKGCGTTSPD